MTIYLHDIFPVEQIAKLDDFKVHFAVFDGKNQPLGVWVRDKKEWQEWQEYRGERNHWGQAKYIFSLMQFHRENNTTWLFGGIFEIKEMHADCYVVKLMEYGEEFIGRLKIYHSLKNGQNVRLNMKGLYEKLEVKEILVAPYDEPQ